MSALDKILKATEQRRNPITNAFMGKRIPAEGESDETLLIPTEGSITPITVGDRTFDFVIADGALQAVERGAPVVLSNETPALQKILLSAASAGGQPRDGKTGRWIDSSSGQPLPHGKSGRGQIPHEAVKVDMKTKVQGFSPNAAGGAGHPVEFNGVQLGYVVKAGEGRGWTAHGTDGSPIRTASGALAHGATPHEAARHIVDRINRIREFGPER